MGAPVSRYEQTGGFPLSNIQLDRETLATAFPARRASLRFAMAFCTGKGQPRP